jgi:hypothetical protein
MPSPRTYQAIGYVTYHSWRRELRRRAPAIKRNLAAAAVVALAIAAAAQAARDDDPPAAG